MFAVGGGGRGRFSPREKPERPDDPAVRRHNLHRVFALFKPYKLRLSFVLGLILISSALGVLPAFLLKGALEAIENADSTRLSVLAAGMIVVAIVTGVLGVYQTLLSNRVGQDVMHDLRSKVFRHLQRLSLAFFTRTRTGEVQSRISNDIGGVQSVLTSTATSIVSSVTTVAATAVGMIALSWELSLFAFALVPIFVLLTRRVGAQRRKIATSTQETLADISSLVQESLSVSGILLGKTMGRTEELADRFEGESRQLAGLEVRQLMAGRWVMASIQTTFAVMPAAVYWFGGLALAHGSNAITVPTLIAFTTLQTRLFFPVGSLLNVGLEVQTSLALFDRIFEYLDQPIEIVERAQPVELATAGDVTFEDVWFRYSPDGRLDATRRLVQRPRRDEDGARRRDRRREDDARLPRRHASTTSNEAESRSTASMCATSRSRASHGSSASSRRRRISSTRRCARTCALRSRTRPTRRSRRRSPRRRSAT